MSLEMRKLFGTCSYVVLALVVVALSARSAEATSIRWTLDGVTFNDGATASGSFDYDAVTQLIANLDITTSGVTPVFIDAHGSVSGGHHWIDLNADYPPYPASGFAVLDVPEPADLTGMAFLALTFATPLTNTPGTIALGTNGGEGICVNANCSSGHYHRLFTAGSIIGTELPETGTQVPEPATITLVGAGLAAVARRRLRAGGR